MTTPRMIVAACLVDDLHHPTRFLGAQRSYPPDLVGQWELPGGKREDGEHPTATLVRELHEELGLSPDAIVCGPRLDCPFSCDGRWPLREGLVMEVFLAHITTSDQPHVGNAHLQLRWLTADTALDVEWLAPDRPLAQYIMTLLSSTS